MSYNKWPKRSAEKNYFMVPNEIFSIGLDYREISLYTYLLRCENRETYQCYPSYKTIGKAIGMSENTVAKYVRQLEEKGLIYTEPTIMQSKDGKPLNGNLLYTIRPIIAEAFEMNQEDLKRIRAQSVRNVKVHSAAPSGSWCGGQRQLSAANGSLVLDSRSGFNHHGVVLGCALQDSVGRDLVIQNHGAPACRFPLRADNGAEINLASLLQNFK